MISLTSTQLSGAVQRSAHHSKIKHGYKFFAIGLKFEASRTCGSIYLKNEYVLSHKS